MRISVLSNNYTNNDLPAESGLSLFIEYNGRRILIDGGLDKIFMENAKSMSIDLSTIDYAILTHGHYDHAGGIVNLGKPTLYTHKNSFKERYRLLPDGHDFNGVKWDKQIANCILNDGFTEIEKGVYLSGEIQRPHGTPRNNFFEGDKTTPDKVEDEQLVIFEHQDGL